MSHESHRLGAYYCPVIKKSLSLTCLYLVNVIEEFSTAVFQDTACTFFVCFFSLQKHINTNVLLN